MKNRTKFGLIVLLIVAIIVFLDLLSEEENLKKEELYFEERFEEAVVINDLLKEDLSGWHQIQKNRDKNIVEITSDRAHSGKKALKTYAIPYDGKTASKAAIQRELFDFKKGDHAWISAWFYLEDSPIAENLFLFDIEAPETTVLFMKKTSPGRRIFLGTKEEIVSDLGKWWNKEMFRQPKGKEVPFPKDRWVNVKIHLYLSEDKDGIMEVWQDDIKIIDAKGQILPTADSIYTRVQIGITANGNEEHSQTLYVDDIIISNDYFKISVGDHMVSYSKIYLTIVTLSAIFFFILLLSGYSE